MIPVQLTCLKMLLFQGYGLSFSDRKMASYPNSLQYLCLGTFEWKNLHLRQLLVKAFST